MIVYIPDTMKEHENDLKFMFDLMVRKLDVNRHKGWLKGVTIDTLMKGMMKEIDEVLDEVKNKNQMAAVIEAADVANFAILLGIFSLRMSRDEFVRNSPSPVDPPTPPSTIKNNTLKGVSPVFSFNGA